EGSADSAPEVEPAGPLLAPSGEPRGQLPRQGADRRLHLGQVGTGGVHEVDVLDQGSPQGASNRLSPAVGHETSPDLLLDVGLETLETLRHVLIDQALLEGGQLTFAHEHLDERPLQSREVETPQGSIEVIRTAD